MAASDDPVTRPKINTRSSVIRPINNLDEIGELNPKSKSKGKRPQYDKKRNHCLWPSEDKDMFFESLNEYGKDFEAIQNVFSMRSKRRSDSYPVAKTKDQIRHFYYRTWNKISKYVDEIEGISKDVLEMYALINYGHLRKKIGSKFDSKIGNKLNTLIHFGTIQITVKCRNTRIRTPLCRALKKLNNIDVEDSHCKINLIPYNHTSWARIQAISLNPRLCIKLKTDAMLTDIFAYVNTKWPVYTKEDQMVLKFRFLKKLDTNPISFKRADVRMMSNYIVNNNGASNPQQSPLTFMEMDGCAGDDLEAQRELEEALKLLRDLQAVIDVNGGFTTSNCDNVTINRLRIALSSINVLTILYEWTPVNKSLAIDQTSSLKRLIHLATVEFAQHDGTQINQVINKSPVKECFTFDPSGHQINHNQCTQLTPPNVAGMQRIVGSNNSNAPLSKIPKKILQDTRGQSTSKSNKYDKFKVPATPDSTIVIRPRSKIRLRTRNAPAIGMNSQFNQIDNEVIPSVADNPYTPEEVINQEQNFTYNNDIGKINDDEWSISSDFSLSSFLYDSPKKKFCEHGVSPTKSTNNNNNSGGSGHGGGLLLHHHNHNASSSSSSSSLSSIMNPRPTQPYQMSTSAPQGPTTRSRAAANHSADLSRDSIGRIDIENNLNCLIHETSLDYASKFASLTGTN